MSIAIGAGVKTTAKLVKPVSLVEPLSLEYGFPIAIPLRITFISARFVAHIPLSLAPNLRLKVKVSFLGHQQCGILGAIKINFSINFIYF